MSIVLAVGLVASIAAVMMMEEEPGSDRQRDPTRAPRTLNNSPPGVQLNAAHILIMHSGSKKAPADLNRTKDEARALAEKITGMAREDIGKFASLAKTYSEGPSGTRGGDLGNFDSGVMAPEFSATTQKLKIGEVSEPVETVFGYHVILRKALK